MNVEKAVERACAIQGDLEAGVFGVPYSEPIRRELDEILDTFAAACQTPASARRLVTALSAKRSAPAGASPAELPW